MFWALVIVMGCFIQHYKKWGFSCLGGNGEEDPILVGAVGSLTGTDSFILLHNRIFLPSSR